MFDELGDSLLAWGQLGRAGAILGNLFGVALGVVGQIFVNDIVAGVKASERVQQIAKASLDHQWVCGETIVADVLLRCSDYVAVDVGQAHAGRAKGLNGGQNIETGARSDGTEGGHRFAKLPANQLEGRCGDMCNPVAGQIVGQGQVTVIGERELEPVLDVLRPGDAEVRRGVDAESGE